MNTKLFTLLILLVLGAPAVSLFGQVTVAEVTVADTRTAPLTITVAAVDGSTVSIDGNSHTFTANDEPRAFTITNPSGRKITIYATDNNDITSLDISDCSLIGLSLYSNPKLETFNISNNHLTTLVVSSMTSLKSLDVSGCDALEALACNNTSLETLDVSGLSALKYLYCYDTPLKSLKVSGCTALEELYCYNTYLETLDVSGLSALVWLYCYDTPLKSLNVSGCTALGRLHCYNTYLETLDASGLSALKYLYCYNSQLKSLNVLDCDALEELYADGQKVTIDVPFNYNGGSVDISFNGVAYPINTNDFSFTAGVNDEEPFAGTITIVRAADPRPRHNVAIIPTDGVSVNRSATNEVINGYDFQFTVNVDNEFADYQLTVFVDGEVVSPTLYNNIYIIDNVDSNKVVTFAIERKSDNPTDNAQLSVASVSSTYGEITVETPSNAIVQITNINGRVSFYGKASGTTTVNVDAGIYVVTINGKSVKVVVR